MKKLVLLFALMLMSSLTAVVQANDKSHFGLRAQFDLTTATDCYDMAHFGPGASVGLAYYNPFGRMTYFNASLLFGYNTIDYSGTTPNKYNRVQIDGHISSLGLRLPLDFGLKFYDTQLVRLSVYTGPHLFFNFSLKAKYNEKRAYTEEKVDKDYTHSGMEIAWGLGLAADFAYRWHIHVEGVYGLSRMGRTNDIQVGETTHFNRAALSIGLGYNF